MLEISYEMIKLISQSGFCSNSALELRSVSVSARELFTPQKFSGHPKTDPLIGGVQAFRSTNLQGL